MTDSLPVLDDDALTRIQFYHWDADAYDPEFYANLQKENRTTVVQDEVQEPFDHALSRRVGLGEEACPTCGWKLGDPASRRTVALRHRGENTGVLLRKLVRCRCYLSEAIWQRWAGSKAMVSPRYQDTFLATLKPDRRIRLSEEQQWSMIQRLIDHHASSWLFYGPAGTGKTTYITALFAEALKTWAERFYRYGGPEAVWRIEAHTLLTQHMEYNRRSDVEQFNGSGDSGTIPAPVPLVTKQKIQAAHKAGFKPCLFLDEVDKITLTQSRLVTLFDLIDMVYSCNGQLVMSTNMDPAELEMFFTDRAGPAILRRINEAQDTNGDGAGHCQFIDFHAQLTKKTESTEYSAQCQSVLQKPGTAKAVIKAGKAAREEVSEQLGTHPRSKPVMRTPARLLKGNGW